MNVQDAIKETGVCEAHYDNYTLTVREDENEEFEATYVLSIQIGGMPPHFQKEMKSIKEVEAHLRHEQRAGLEWEVVEGEA